MSGQNFLQELPGLGAQGSGSHCSNREEIPLLLLHSQHLLPSPRRALTALRGGHKAQLCIQTSPLWFFPDQTFLVFKERCGSAPPEQLHAGRAKTSGAHHHRKSKSGAPAQDQKTEHNADTTLWLPWHQNCHPDPPQLLNSLCIQKLLLAGAPPVPLSPYFIHSKIIP